MIGKILSAEQVRRIRAQSAGKALQVYRASAKLAGDLDTVAEITDSGMMELVHLTEARDLSAALRNKIKRIRGERKG